MSYYESAEGMTITQRRALKELRDHGIEDFTEFYEDLGDHDNYEAQAVLAWLGY